MVFSTGMILLISGIFGIAAVVLLTAVVNGWLNRKEGNYENRSGGNTVRI